MMDQCHRKILLLSGAMLFLIGLLGGVAVQSFENPRMGLSAHLAGVQNGIFLLLLGGVWHHIRLSQPLLGLVCWFNILGMYLFWLSLTLSAVWGTSRATPIAGAGFNGMMWKENVVQVLLYSASASSIISAALLVVGFWQAFRSREVIDKSDGLQL
jgi:hydroxylaminobenzene mutase